MVAVIITRSSRKLSVKRAWLIDVSFVCSLDLSAGWEVTHHTLSQLGASLVIEPPQITH